MRQSTQTPRTPRVAEQAELPPPPPAKAARRSEARSGPSPAMPPVQALAERDAAIRLLGDALTVVRALTTQCHAFAELAESAGVRADDYKRAYEDSHARLLEKLNRVCVAQCCGPDDGVPHLVRLIECGHFVCMKYVRKQLFSSRTTVKIDRRGPAEARPLITCPVCSGAPQLWLLVEDVVPYSSSTAAMPVRMVTTEPVDQLRADIIANKDLATFEAGRALQSRCEDAPDGRQPLLLLSDDSDDELQSSESRISGDSYAPYF